MQIQIDGDITLQNLRELVVTTTGWSGNSKVGASGGLITVQKSRDETVAPAPEETPF